MFKEKQFIKFGLYAERSHRLAFDIALAAAELGQYGEGMAIVANEMRSIGNKLYTLFDQELPNEAGILDAAKQLQFLAINGCLEMIRLHESQLTLKKRLAVILEEIRTIAVDIESLFGVKQELPLVRPKLAEKSTVMNDSSLFQSGIRYVLFSIGDITFCEAVENVMEIFMFVPSDPLKDNYVQIRGERIPVLNYYEKLSLKQKSRENEIVLRISTKYEEKPKQFAVLADSLPVIFYAGFGRNVEPLRVPSQFIRECWNCEEDLQMMFLDYSNFN